MAFPVTATPPRSAPRPRSAGDEEQISRILQRYAYEEVAVPLVDRAAPYENVLPPDLLRRTYRFTDREGELLLLRSDFTPFVARRLAPSVGRDVIRAFYRGDIVRMEDRNGVRGGTRRQIGAEVIGGDAEVVDAEILRLIAEICSDLRLQCTVTMSDSGLLEEIVAGLEEGESRERLRAAIAMKRRDSISAICASLPRALAKVAEQSVRGALSVEDLLECETTRAAGTRLSRLEKTIREVDGSLVTPFLAIDSLEGDRGYYTGFRFDVFTPSATEPIASGGRYDRLYGCFGFDAPAAGFTFDLDAVEEDR